VGVDVTDSTIVRVYGRRVWDSRGRPTVEVEVQLESGVRGRAIAPAGASRGSREPIEMRDGDRALGGMGVARALSGINTEIAGILIGRSALRQEEIDDDLVTLDGTPTRSRLGGNAMIAASMAVLHAAAASTGQSLFAYLARGKPVRLPLPEIQIFGGGAHAGRRVDVQDFMIVPLGAGSFDEAMEMTAEVYRAAGELMDAGGKLHGVADEGGFWPAFDSNEEALTMVLRAIERAGYHPLDNVGISLDVAASQLGRSGRYTLGLERRELDTDAMCELLLSWIARYPIVSIEDPLGEDDVTGWKQFTAAAGARVQIVGDDFLVTRAQRVKTAAAAGACNAVLIKPNQAGTVTETKAALDAGKQAGWGTIVSARSGETEDLTIAHLAVGWDAGQLKVGSFARSERMAKWNEVLRIEETLGDRAVFAGRRALGSLDIA
jgi:enolase